MRTQTNTTEMTTRKAALLRSALWCALLTPIPLLSGCYEHVVSVKGGPYNGMIYKGNLDDPSQQSSNAAKMRDRANADYQKQVEELQKPREN